ncbi:MAG: hypothetical protein K9J16_14735 [Melioribacteraceae bacterium]|nr:hypothetical protein [Melioribacteraceae bacterium]MCF8355820.1 hypothetical protein [Melioribacteraceae bacterium]MCF8395287.1 hypothetical protein [Melioribacteraceae bacterium]MCF8420726.1 hypothetical protein [Melioribacteraceae bacterium]
MKKRLSLKTVLLFSAAAFYISLLINVLVPFNKNVFFITGIFISASGIAPGYFFIYSKEMFTKVKQLFFHENNGFVFGTLISLVLVLFAGRWVLYLGPLTGIMLFFLESFYEYLNLPINNRTDEV